MKRPLLLLSIFAVACAAVFAGAPDAQKKAEALVAEVSKDVAKMRAFEFKKPVALAVLTPEEMQKFLEGEIERQWPKDQFEADDRAMKAVGLLPAAYDLRAGLVALYKEQAAGVYDLRAHRMLMPKDKGLDDLARVVLSHELTHALQDQHFDLSKLVGVPGSTIDHDMVVMMLIEGDAMVLMQEYIQGGRVNMMKLLGEAFMRGAAGGGEALADAPPFLSRMLYAPYLYGPPLIMHYFGAADGGWARVDRLYADPPLVSKQAMHPGKYPLDTFHPVRIDLTDIPPKPAEKKRCNTSLGEFGSLALFDSWGELLRDPKLSDAAARLAEGWAGDRLTGVDGADGSYTLIWASTWESAETATAVRDAAARWAEHWVATGTADDPRSGRVFRPDEDGKPGNDVILVLIRPPAKTPAPEPKCPAYRKVPIRSADDLPRGN